MAYKRPKRRHRKKHRKTKGKGIGKVLSTGAHYALKYGLPLANAYASHKEKSELKSRLASGRLTEADKRKLLSKL